MNKEKRNKKLLKLIHKVNSMVDYTLYDKFFCYKLKDGKVFVITYHSIDESVLKPFIDGEKK